MIFFLMGHSSVLTKSQLKFWSYTPDTVQTKGFFFAGWLPGILDVVYFQFHTWSEGPEHPALDQGGGHRPAIEQDLVCRRLAVPRPRHQHLLLALQLQ